MHRTLKNTLAIIDNVIYPLLKRVAAVALVSLCTRIALAGMASAADLHQAVNLRAEYAVNPLGLETQQPRLSWQMLSVAQGEKQTAYRILVASSRDLLDQNKGDLWDSGRVVSDQSTQVLYKGKPLASSQRCFWKVQIQGTDGLPLNWSKVAEWTMGLLAPEDWGGAEWMRAPVRLGLTSDSPKLTADRVRHASYQNARGRRAIDVTDRLKELLKSGTPIIVSNALFKPDTPPGRDPRDLVVDVEIDGAIKRIEGRRGSPLMITESGVPSPWMRKTFNLEGVAQRALVRLESRGYHELWVNGQPASEFVLNPSISVYKRRHFYVTYDITPLLHKGDNAIGIWLGRGWNVLGNPGVEDERPMARLHLELVNNGKSSKIVSDKTWVTSNSSYRALSAWEWGNHGGELVDARLSRDSWCRVDDKKSWEPVEIAKAPEGVESRSHLAPLTRIGKRIPAISCEKQEDGSYLVDFGTNLTGWLEMKMPVMEAGHQVDFEFQQRDDGSHFFQFDRFISGGRDGEVFMNKFNWHGFGRVKITGLPSAPVLGNMKALLVESDLEQAGGFKSSNAQINWIYDTDLWTIRCLNLNSYLVDCPHRERLGYGDGQIAIESMMMNFWAPGFYAKWAQDWADTQEPNGQLPFSTPYHPPAFDGTFGREGPPGWGGAFPAILWRTYLYYGDTRLLEKFYEPMNRYLQRIESHCHDNLFRSYGDEWQALGDWVAPGRGMDTKNWPDTRANELFNNAYRIYLWNMMAQINDALGKHDEAARNRLHIQRIRPLIHKEFWDAKKGFYSIDEQAYQVMPLMTGIVPDELRGDVMKKLEKMILDHRGGHLDTGMLGTYFMFQYLSEIGRNDLLFTMATQTDYPGWGYMRGQGATTFWEQWNGHASRIHSCFTGPAGWIHNALAGIRPDPATPGMKNVIIKPAIVGDMKWVKAHHDSPYGRIVSNWKLDGDQVTMEVFIPPNSTCTVYLPTKNAGSVRVNGKLPTEVKYVRFLRMEDGAALFTIDSGRYTFKAKWSP